MLLCDLILKREFSVADVYQLQDDLAVLERSFGKAKMETLDYYEATMRARDSRRSSAATSVGRPFPLWKMEGEP
jgi:hypothetical protein